MLKVQLKRMIALVMTLAVVVSILIPYASAAFYYSYAACNVSYDPVTCNYSNGPLPPDATNVYEGDNIYFNFHVANSKKLQSITVCYKLTNGSWKSKTDPAKKSYIRYSAIRCKLGELEKKGYLYYFFVIKYTNGSEEYFPSGARLGTEVYRMPVKAYTTI